jgi:transposase InsO family protein
MDKESKEKIALFRYGVISEFVSGRDFARGEKARLIAEKCRQKWFIPSSQRTRISKSVLKSWIKAYRDAGGELAALYPKEREDRGRIRAVDGETILGLVALRKELPTKPLPILLREARARGIIQVGEFISRATIYRILQIYSEEFKKPPEDRRKFESEQVNDMWQSDVMHGPMVLVLGKLRKAYLLAIIDDHSRFIIHAEFYLSERLEDYLDVLRKALLKRGIPKKLYVDNGAAFRSHQLEFICASLGIALIHAKPYQPQGKGKIERWFRTVRMSFLAGLNKTTSLDELNKQLSTWLQSYQEKNNSAIKEKPQQRFLRGVEYIKLAPTNLEYYFRKMARRSVRNDRTIAFRSALYEAPVELIGKQIQLFYHEHEPEKVEAVCNGKSYGFLRLVDANVNYRVSRSKKNQTELIPNQNSAYSGGQLFENNTLGGTANE